MIALGLCYALEQEGYSVIHCDTIQAAKKAIKEYCVAAKLWYYLYYKNM